MQKLMDLVAAQQAQIAELLKKAPAEEKAPAHAKDSHQRPANAETTDNTGDRGLTANVEGNSSHSDQVNCQHYRCLGSLPYIPYIFYFLCSFIQSEQIKNKGAIRNPNVWQVFWWCFELTGPIHIKKKTEQVPHNSHYPTAKVLGGAAANEVPALDLPGDVEPAPEKADESQEVSPEILHVVTLTKNQRDQIKRVVCPKRDTGRLEVPRDIYELWQTEKGKEKLFNLWCKSGGVKARLVFCSFRFVLMCYTPV